MLVFLKNIETSELKKGFWKVLEYFQNTFASDT